MYVPKNGYNNKQLKSTKQYNFIFQHSLSRQKKAKTLILIAKVI